MIEKPELEMMFELWPNDMPYHYEIGPDRDGLGCIEIRYFEDRKKDEVVDRMMFDLETAKLIHTALGKLIAEKESEKKD